jgi:hypothetical protein
MDFKAVHQCIRKVGRPRLKERIRNLVKQGNGNVASRLSMRTLQFECVIAARIPGFVGGISKPPLPKKLQRKLNNPSGRSSAYRTEAGSVGHVGIRIVEIYLIKNIEELGAELDFVTLMESKVFED